MIEILWKCDALLQCYNTLFLTSRWLQKRDLHQTFLPQSSFTASHRYKGLGCGELSFELLDILLVILAKHLIAENPSLAIIQTGIFFTVVTTHADTRNCENVPFSRNTKKPGNYVSFFSNVGMLILGPSISNQWKTAVCPKANRQWDCVNQGQNENCQGP